MWAVSTGVATGGAPTRRWRCARAADGPTTQRLGVRPATADPDQLSSSDVLDLQRSVGNAAVTALIQPARVPTLTVQRASAAMGEGAQTWVRPGDTGPDVIKLQQRLNGIKAAGTRSPRAASTTGGRAAWSTGSSPPTDSIRTASSVR